MVKVLLFQKMPQPLSSFQKIIFWVDFDVGENRGTPN